MAVTAAPARIADSRRGGGGCSSSYRFACKCAANQGRATTSKCGNNIRACPGRHICGAKEYSVLVSRICNRTGAGTGARTGSAMIMRRNVRCRQRVAGDRAGHSLRSKRRRERDAAA